MSLDRAIRQLRESVGSHAAAVVSRDGLVIAGDLPESISKETFAIMCATILGAGMTAATELRYTAPSHIVMSTKEARIHIFEAGPRALIVIVTPPDTGEDAVRAALEPVMEEVRRDIG